MTYNPARRTMRRAAVERGMRVVRGRRHDGTEGVAVRGESHQP